MSELTRADIEHFSKTGQMPNDWTGKPAKRFRQALCDMALRSLPDEGREEAVPQTTYKILDEAISLLRAHDCNYAANLCESSKKYILDCPVS